MTKYVENFFDWAYKWYEKAKKDKNVRFSFFPNERITFLLNIKTGETAFARCKSSEVFVAHIGIGVAYARFCKEEIPKEIIKVPIRVLLPGDKFRIWHSVKEKDDDKNFFVVGEVPCNKKLICYCDNEKNFYTTSKNRKVLIPD